MYVYKRKNRKQVYMIMGLSVAILLCAAFALLLTQKEGEAIPIIKEEESVVITLPEEEQKVIYPFSVEASVVKEYFDGNTHEVSDYTVLEGVYRPNQGMDFAYQKESFDVLCMLDGVVSEVKEDVLFGNSITIKSEHVSITYQSLDKIQVNKGDSIKQKDVLGKASLNSYNPELGNHLHIVTCVNEKVVDPKLLIGKCLSEIK